MICVQRTVGIQTGETLPRPGGCRLVQAELSGEERSPAEKVFLEKPLTEFDGGLEYIWWV